MDWYVGAAILFVFVFSVTSQMISDLEIGSPPCHHQHQKYYRPQTYDLHQLLLFEAKSLKKWHRMDKILAETPPIGMPERNGSDKMESKTADYPEHLQGKTDDRPRR